MSKTSRRNVAFGQWVRKTRLALGLKQRDLISPSLSQQDWSRIEQGYVPFEDKLILVCHALARPIDEARSIIGTTSTEKIAIYQQDWAAFKDRLVKSSLHKDRGYPVRVMLIREASEEFSLESINQYYEILARSGKLQLAILFRYSDPRIWQSFSWVAEQLMRRWNSESRNRESLREKFAGFYRHPDFEESPYRALPMAFSILLEMDSVPSVYSYSSDEQLYMSQKKFGVHESRIRQDSMVLLGTSRNEAVSQVIGWVGAELLLGHTSQHWVPIPLPEI